MYVDPELANPENEIKLSIFKHTPKWIFPPELMSLLVMSPPPHYRFCLNSNKLPLSEKTKYGRFVMVLLRTGEGSTHARLWTKLKAQQSFHFNFIFPFPTSGFMKAILSQYFLFLEINILRKTEEVRAWVLIVMWFEIRSFQEILCGNYIIRFVSCNMRNGMGTRVYILWQPLIQLKYLISLVPFL